MIENINPSQAAELLDRDDAVLIDVRTTMEYGFVGHPLNAVHIPWQEAPGWEVNPGFVEQVRARLSEQSLDEAAHVVTMCRSGKRSLEAAQVLEQAGFQHLYNMLEGFEGDLDAQKHRNTVNGWRHRGLPWEQS